MLLLLGILVVGTLLGLLLRNVSLLVATNRYLTYASLSALLAVMGAKLAQHRALFTKDLNIFFAAIGSSVALTAVFFLVFWIVGLCKKKDTHEIPALIEFTSPDVAPVGHARSGGSFKELLSVALNGGCILVGFIVFFMLPETYSSLLSIDSLANWLLISLLFFIGFDLGTELYRLDLRRLSLMLLLVPFLNIALSLLTGLLFGVFVGLGARDGVLLTAGMGWYSLSSVLLAERGMMVISILAFIHNVFRELLAILCTPLAARISPMLPIYLGGATSMDIMLPFVQRYCGKDYTLASFYSGVVCSMAVMPLVKFIAG